ncbi:hypothetical protein BDZ45DRAFT_755295 [Acephala macrosclerotiorum]|nr:hypothetical protein BDZ45DRAFT_755295 [Acephala macrosclerotiorum]
MRHRLRLAQVWNIKPGSRVLEIGCGQGDTTVVLADAVGERGEVHALDPGSLTYGSPSNLGQAQEHIKNSPVGSRITFHTFLELLRPAERPQADSPPRPFPRLPLSPPMPTHKQTLRFKQPFPSPTIFMIKQSFHQSNIR